MPDSACLVESAGFPGMPSLASIRTSRRFPSHDSLAGMCRIGVSFDCWKVKAYVSRCHVVTVVTR
ncbi:hypothetical protein [Gluconobacter roseus]|uniref:hypothetical protein n=1 Tax=Gluconobacter roseus TaxID=586239 RepID=UPI0011448FE9|nr:hypothetical protein [Gluconobacter roseus]